MANVYSPWLQRVCGAGETPLKCKPAPLPRRAGHGQAQPRKGAFKDTDGADNSAVYHGFQPRGPALRRYPKPGTGDNVTPAGPASPAVRHFTSEELWRPASRGKAVGGRYQEVPIREAEPSPPETTAGLWG